MPPLYLCAICMLPMSWTSVRGRNNTGSSKSAITAHVSCRRACESDDADILQLVKSRDSWWTLSDRQAFLRARKFTIPAITQLWQEQCQSSELARCICALPMELVDMIAKHTFPSLLSRHAMFRLTARSLQSQDADPLGVLAIKQLIALRDLQLSKESFSLILEISEHSCAHWSLCSSNLLPAAALGRWYLSLESSALLDLIERLAEPCISWRDLIRLLESQGRPLRFWSTLQHPPFSTIHYLSKIHQLGKLPMQLQVIDNTQPLVGVTTVTNASSTVAIVTHHQHSNEVNLIAYLDRRWPEGVFQYWALELDNIEALWIRYRGDFYYGSNEIVMRTTKGRMLHAGSQITGGRDKFDFALVTDTQPKHIVLGYNDSAYSTLVSIGTIPPGDEPQVRPAHEARPVYEDSLWPTSNRQPRGSAVSSGHRRIAFTQVNASDYETCILAVDKRWNCIRGIMFLGSSGSAVLGQWRHGIDDAADAERLSLVDGVRVCNRSDRPGQRVCRADDDEGIHLEGPLEWWFCHGWAMVAIAGLADEVLTRA